MRGVSNKHCLLTFFIVVKIDFKNMGHLIELHELTNIFFLYFSCSDSDDSDEECSNKSE